MSQRGAGGKCPIVLIRPLTVTDAKAFWEMLLRAFTESPLAFNTSPDEWRAHPLSEVEGQLDRAKGSPSDVVFGAFDPSLCGHVGLRREPRRKLLHRATLWGLYVAPEVRGRGGGWISTRRLVVSSEPSRSSLRRRSSNLEVFRLHLRVAERLASRRKCHRGASITRDGG